jgi:hypothetical protein
MKESRDELSLVTGGIFNTNYIGNLSSENMKNLTV